MRQFDYTEKWKKLLTPEIVGYLSKYKENRGCTKICKEK